MALRLVRRVALPAHRGEGGFDGAALHPETGRLYVAHAANDALDVLDARLDLYLYSVPGVRGAAGVLVAPELNEVFVAARGEGKIAFLQSGDGSVETMVVGRKPACLAWDASRQTLWVGRGDSRSWGVTVVDFGRAAVGGEIAVQSAPAAMVFATARDAAYIALTGAGKLAVVDGSHPLRVAREWTLPAPVGALALDASGGRLYAACADGSLLALDTASGHVAAQARLPEGAGGICLLPGLGRLYAALGGDGMLAVLDAATLEVLETIPTERDATILAGDTARNKVTLLCPGSCAALVYRDG